MVHHFFQIECAKRYQLKKSLKKSIILPSLKNNTVFWIFFFSGEILVKLIKSESYLYFIHFKMNESYISLMLL